MFFHHAFVRDHIVWFHCLVEYSNEIRRNEVHSSENEYLLELKYLSHGLVDDTEGEEMKGEKNRWLLRLDILVRFLNEFEWKLLRDCVLISMKINSTELE